MLKKKDKKISPWVIAVPVIVLAVWIGWQLIIKFEGVAPVVATTDLPSAISKSQDLSLNISDKKSGLRKIRVGLLQGAKETVLLEKEFPRKGFLGGGSVKETPVDIPLMLKESGVSDGKVTLGISVWDYSWRNWWHGNTTYIEKSLLVDTHPARIEVLSNAHNVAQGGAGLIVYRLSEACPKTGVMVGDNFFPGIPGYYQDPLVYLCFFAVRHDQGPDTTLSLEAVDVAGNQSKTEFYHYIQKKQFKTDTIDITDSFITSKTPEFDMTGDNQKSLSPVEQFLKINRDIRKENTDTIFHITSRTDSVMHWQGVFERLPAAANRATYAEARTYLYHGKIIDHETHLGTDLASVAHSKVPAANTGRVAFTGRLGIYGNAVIIDHGFGLFSLYGHLSYISVQEGQTVHKGETIGHTGSTGMAGGDHLHFSMIVHDTFVNPLEWWDAAWIENNITSKLAQGIPVAP